MRPIDAPWLRHRDTRCSTFKIYRHRYREIRARGRCVTAVEKSHAPRTTMNHRLSFRFEQFSACLRIPDALSGSYSVGSAMFREGWRVRSSKRSLEKNNRYRSMLRWARARGRCCSFSPTSPIHVLPIKQFSSNHGGATQRIRTIKSGKSQSRSTQFSQRIGRTYHGEKSGGTEG